MNCDNTDDRHLDTPPETDGETGGEPAPETAEAASHPETSGEAGMLRIVAVKFLV